MVLKLYGHPLSTCTKRVLVVLKETNTLYEYINVDLFKDEHKTADFYEKQPFGQVPYIDDDGFILFESRPITHYICKKAGSPLLPTGDVKKEALHEQAESIETSNYNPYATDIVSQSIFIPMVGGETDEVRVQQCASILESKLGGYEKILSKQEFLAGDEITLADLSHLPHGVLLSQIGFTWLEDEAKFPNVARWWKHLANHPTWVAVLKETETTH